MNFLSFIEAKRDGRTLTSEEIEAIITEYTAGRIPDYQMAAFLMAIYFRGLDRAETRALTLAMRDSGEVLKFPSDPRPLVDKHSTGGVGDKISLTLVPLLACLGFRVPMISGRGLGITGGTVDKLESIPGFNTQLSPDRIIAQVQSIGCVMCGPTAMMVPADKSLYGLRDVTGTIASISLITASILSKKIAQNISAQVLDIKFGAAAFMKDIAEARDLARLMVALGNECGVNTRAILTAMDSPIGRAAGNWLEVKETVACLEGRGSEDLNELVITCAAHLLVQTGRANDLQAAAAQAITCLASGAPRKKWDEMLVAQDADLKAFNAKLSMDHTAPAVKELRSSRSGFVSRCDARIIGEIIRDLGAGRLTKDSGIDPEVGIDHLVKRGDRIAAGSVLARVDGPNLAAVDDARARLLTAFEISDEPPVLPPLIAESILK